MTIGISFNSTKTDHIIVEHILSGVKKLTSFSTALAALKSGFKVKRNVWSDEYLVLIEYGNQAKECRKAGVVKVGEGDFQTVYSYIAYCSPDIFLPWSATYVDILEEDWIII